MPFPVRRVAQHAIPPDQQRDETDRQLGRLVNSREYGELEHEKRQKLIFWRRLCIFFCVLTLLLAFGGLIAAIYTRTKLSQMDLEQKELNRLLDAYENGEKTMKGKFAKLELEKQRCEEKLAKTAQAAQSAPVAVSVEMDSEAEGIPDMQDEQVTAAFSLTTSNATKEFLEESPSIEDHEEELNHEEMITEPDVGIADPPAAKPITSSWFRYRYSFTLHDTYSWTAMLAWVPLFLLGRWLWRR